MVESKEIRLGVAGMRSGKFSGDLSAKGPNVLKASQRAGFMLRVFSWMIFSNSMIT